MPLIKHILIIFRTQPIESPFWFNDEEDACFNLTQASTSAPIPEPLKQAPKLQTTKRTYKKKEKPAATTATADVFAVSGADSDDGGLAEEPVSIKRKLYAPESEVRF